MLYLPYLEIIIINSEFFTNFTYATTEDTNNSENNYLQPQSITQNDSYSDTYSDTYSQINNDNEMSNKINQSSLYDLGDSNIETSFYDNYISENEIEAAYDMATQNKIDNTENNYDLASSK